MAQLLRLSAENDRPLVVVDGAEAIGTLSRGDLLRTLSRQYGVGRKNEEARQGVESRRDGGRQNDHSDAYGTALARIEGKFVDPKSLANTEAREALAYIGRCLDILKHELGRQDDGRDPKALRFDQTAALDVWENALERLLNRLHCQRRLTF